MAQGNKPEAGLGDAGIEAGRLVVLAKPLPSGAGYYPHFAVIRLQDLPEELRRQIAAAAAAAAQGDARRYHAADSVDVVPEGLRRQLPGLVSGPNDASAVKSGGDGSSDAVNECSERRILPAVAQGGGRERDGKVVAAYLDASRLQVLGDMEGSLLGMEEALSQAWTMEHSADEAWTRLGAKYMVVANDYWEPSNFNMAAGQRAAHADVGAFDGDGLPARENAAPGLGNDRATECGGAYYYLLPAAGEPLRAVQVLVDAAAGGKAGDPIPAGVKAAGVDAGHEHGNLSGLLGIAVASSAGTAIVTGTVGPVTAFGLFVALVGGLSLAMASVRAR